MSKYIREKKEPQLKHQCCRLSYSECSSSGGGNSRKGVPKRKSPLIYMRLPPRWGTFSCIILSTQVALATYLCLPCHVCQAKQAITEGCRSLGHAKYFIFSLENYLALPSACHLRSCRFITVVHGCLKVPTKNSPALLFLSRGKKKKEKKTISCIPLLRKSRAGEFSAGTFKHACTTVIKRQDRNWRAGYPGEYFEQVNFYGKRQHTFEVTLK